MRKTINKSVTVNNTLLEDMETATGLFSFTEITSTAFNFFIKYHDKINNNDFIDNSGRGFELVSMSNRKGEFAELPLRKSVNSSGYDFLLPENVMLSSGESSKLIFTNVKVFMNDNEILNLHIKNSKNIILKDLLIEKDYYNNPENEGNIGIILHNISKENIFLEKGEKIMQGVFQQFLNSSNCNTDDKL